MPFPSISSNTASQFGMTAHPANRMSNIQNVLGRIDSLTRPGIMRDVHANIFIASQIPVMNHRLMAGIVGAHLHPTSATRVPLYFPETAADDSARILELIRQGASDMSGDTATVSKLGTLTFAEDDDSDVTTLTNIQIRLPGQGRNATRAFRKLFYDWMVDNLSDDDLATIAVHVSHG